ncbi:MAG: substrate-binding domain-containing protein [Firmicutes bacterium]|nr:substrate-binding domain-containing protein [Bacillota bacterium]
MKRLLCAVMIISVLFAACGCADTAVPVTPPEITDEDLYAVEVEENDWPVIEGTSVFLPYYTAAAARMLEISEDEASRYVLCSVPNLAYSDLITGAADIIFCHLPNELQARFADHEGVTLACYPVLNEAFVFFVSPDNPVDSLTLEQLRAVYTGAVTNWSELGGNDEVILPFRRSAGSSDHTGLVQFVADDSELAPAPQEERTGTMGETAEVAANYDGSAGAIGCGYLSNVRQQYGGMALKILKIEGCEASSANIRKGVYPLISQVCAVIRGGEEESPAGQLAQWCAWPLGQALAVEKGYEPNMETDAQPESEAAFDTEGTAPESGWAEGPVSLKGKGPQWDAEILSDSDRLFADCVTVSGLEDKKVEETVNKRIRSTVEAFCDEGWLPDAQGIQAALDAGLDSANCRYKYIQTQVTACSGDLLSVAVVCRANFDMPRTGNFSSASAFFTSCETLNFDLKTGKEVPVTAFVPEGKDALSVLNGAVREYLRVNADEIYRDEDYTGHTEGIAEVEVCVTRFPGLVKDQKYYVDASEQKLYLVLDVDTPWAVTGYDYSCLPLELDILAR